MPGCVLRVSGFDSGPDFDVDVFLRGTDFQPCRVFHRGERWSAKRNAASSGFYLVVSEADGDHLRDQVADAITFLRKNHALLRRLNERDDVEAMLLDFGTDFPTDAIGRFHRLPIDLLRECATLGIEIELSVYHRSAQRGCRDGATPAEP
jgi:hypothetical protein